MGFNSNSEKEFIIITEMCEIMRDEVRQTYAFTQAISQAY